MERVRGFGIRLVIAKAIQEGWAISAEEMPNAPDAWKRRYDEVGVEMQKKNRNIAKNVAKRLVEFCEANNLDTDSNLVRVLMEVAIASKE